jgi:hypothetical protein
MSVIRDFQVNGLNPVAVGGTGTTVKYFPRLMSASAYPLLGTAPSTPSSTNPAGMLVIPAQNELNGQNFVVTAVGNYLLGASAGSETVTIALYAVTGSLASPTYTAICSTGAVTPTPNVDGIQHSWMLKASLYGDTLSGIMGGSYSAFDNGVLQNSTPKQSVVVSGLDFNVGNVSLGVGAVAGLVVGVTFSVSNASNAAKMYQFNIEQA